MGSCHDLQMDNVPADGQAEPFSEVAVRLSSPLTLPVPITHCLLGEHP